MAALSTHRFPPPRRGLMCKVFTRHNAGKVVTMTRNTSSNSTDDTAPWPCPGTTICPATAVPTARQSTQEMVQPPATGIIQGAFLQEGPGSDLSSPRWGREQTVESGCPSYPLPREVANPSHLGPTCRPLGCVAMCSLGIGPSPGQQRVVVLTGGRQRSFGPSVSTAGFGGC